MEFPPIAWLILVLGVVWLVLRVWSRRADEKRREEREERMARLYEERERLAGDEPPRASAAKPHDDAEPPSSLAAMTSDPGERASAAPKERRCLGCGTVNDATATTCSKCGFEL